MFLLNLLLSAVAITLVYHTVLAIFQPAGASLYFISFGFILFRCYLYFFRKGMNNDTSFLASFSEMVKGDHSDTSFLASFSEMIASLLETISKSNPQYILCNYDTSTLLIGTIAVPVIGFVGLLISKKNFHGNDEPQDGMAGAAVAAHNPVNRVERVISTEHVMVWDKVGVHLQPIVNNRGDTVVKLHFDYEGILKRTVRAVVEEQDRLTVMEYTGFVYGYYIFY